MFFVFVFAIIAQFFFFFFVLSYFIYRFKCEREYSLHAKALHSGHKRRLLLLLPVQNERYFVFFANSFLASARRKSAYKLRISQQQIIASFKPVLFSALQN